MPKKIFALLFALAALAAFACPQTALAAEEEAQYARVIRGGVYLYEEADADTGLFELPESWFVRVTARLGEYCAVAYLEGVQGRTPVQGYCKTEELLFVAYVPETPYLFFDVDVTFTAGDPSLPDGFFTTYTVPAAYYGSFSFGSATYCYVELDGSFGYVPASACSTLDYPRNTEYTEQEAAPAEEPPSKGGAVVGAVLACLLAAAALGIAVFLFRPARTRRKPKEEAGGREDVYF